jgi:hypothetical protein
MAVLAAAVELVELLEAGGLAAPALLVEPAYQQMVHFLENLETAVLQEVQHVIVEEVLVQIQRKQL